MFGNRGNRGPRLYSCRPWDAGEWRRLRLARDTAPASATDRDFWRAVAEAMGTGRSPEAVARRAEQRGLRAKIATE